MAKIVGTYFNQDGLEQFQPLVNSAYRRHFASRGAITITEKYSSNNHRFTVKGVGISYKMSSGSLVLRGGSITSITNQASKKGSWQTVVRIDSIKMSASKLYSATSTKTRRDDIAFVRDMFASNDIFKISGSSNNIIRAYSGNDQVYTKGGDDILDGGVGNDKLYGGAGSDKLYGGAGSDKLYGGAGSDKLYGGNNNDLLVGGVGIDRLNGGKGKDLFRVQKGAGYAIIEDFINGQDRIHLASGASGLRMVNRNGSAFIYQGGDLIARVEDAAGELERQGSFLV